MESEKTIEERIVACSSGLETVEVSEAVRTKNHFIGYYHCRSRLNPSAGFDVVIMYLPGRLILRTPEGFIAFNCGHADPIDWLTVAVKSVTGLVVSIAPGFVDVTEHSAELVAELVRDLDADPNHESKGWNDYVSREVMNVREDANAVYKIFEVNGLANLKPGYYERFTDVFLKQVAALRHLVKLLDAMPEVAATVTSPEPEPEPAERFPDSLYALLKIGSRQLELSREAERNRQAIEKREKEYEWNEGTWNPFTVRVKAQITPELEPYLILGEEAYRKKYYPSGMGFHTGQVVLKIPGCVSVQFEMTRSNGGDGWEPWRRNGPFYVSACGYEADQPKFESLYVAIARAREMFVEQSEEDAKSSENTD